MVALWMVGTVTVGRLGVLHAAAFTMAEGRIPVAWGRENLLLSLWYTGPVLGIIAVHESGHLLAARRYGVPMNGPYLIPWPSTWASAVSWIWLPTIGVLGAFLRLKGQFPSKLAQWDIAFTGLFAGFLATLICMACGAAWSPSLPGSHVFGQFWSPRIMRVVTGADVAWHPVMMAARVGWCLTVVSLLPMAPADGGRLFWIIPDVWTKRKWNVCALGVICLLCWVP